MRQSKTLESRSELLGENQNKLINNLRKYKSKAAVLEMAINDNILKNNPTLVVCPECGEVVKTYEQGLPESIPHFDVRCPTCEILLKRWCGVAIDATYREIIKSQDLKSIVQEYWNYILWSGITTNRGGVRNDEFVDRFGTKASEFGWDCQLMCPLCRGTVTDFDRSVSEVPDRFDYHHWSEYPDRGIMLCRDCHNIINFYKRDYDVEQLAHGYGFRSRSDLQILRLALRDAIVTGRPLVPKNAEYLVNRYNLILTVADVEKLIQTLQGNLDLYDRVVDDSLWENLC